MATESSVVVALREVRRLEHERRRREEEARTRRPEAESHGWDQARVSQSHAIQQRGEGHGWTGPGYGNGFAGFDDGQALRRTREVIPVGHAPQIWEPPAYAPTPKKSSVPAVLMTMLLMGAAAGAGYWKLNQDFQAKMVASTRDRVQVEQARNEAIEARAKGEADAKVRIEALEAKVAELTVKLAAAAAPPAEVAGKEPAPPPAEKPSRPQRTAKAEAKKPEPKKAEKPAAAATKPKIAKKRIMTDDPLGGLGGLKL